MARYVGDTKPTLEQDKQKEEIEQQNKYVIKDTELKYSKFSLDNIIGRGLDVIVYKGTYKQADVAIKHFGYSPEKPKQDEFNNEKAIMEKLEELHSVYLVKFYGYCLERECFLVMEYMPEGTLENLLMSNSSLDWSKRYQIAHDISLGLKDLHDNNILHRDIKSPNVLLKNGRAKLCDFGVSYIIGESNNRQNLFVGTFRWKAPESFHPKLEFTKSSDIYNLGMTFWEIASRKNPFDVIQGEDSHIDVFNKVSKEEREIIPEDCPKRFSTLILSCWKQQASERPTINQIADYLQLPKEQDFEAFIKAKLASAVQPAVGAKRKAKDTAGTDAAAAKKADDDIPDPKKAKPNESSTAENSQPLLMSAAASFVANSNAVATADGAGAGVAGGSDGYNTLQAASAAERTAQEKPKLGK